MLRTYAPTNSAGFDTALPEVRVERPSFIPEDPRADMGKLIELTNPQRTRLKKWLKDRLSEWESDTSDLARRLTDDNELVEGLIPETNWPWPGAPSIHVPITEMYMEVFKSVEKRSILGADVIWYPETNEQGEILEMLTDIGDALNYFARNEWNCAEALSKVFWTTNRDGLGIIQATWAEESEPADELIVCRNEQDFLEEFPDGESVGLTPEEWEQARAYVAQNASDEFPIEIPITLDRVTYHGVKCEIVELINFVRIPTDIEHIKDAKCRGYGKRFWLRSESLREKAREEVYYQKAVQDLVAKRSRGTQVNTFRLSQQYIDGISDSNKDNFEVFELVVKGRLDGTKVLDKAEENAPAPTSREGKYLVTYSKEHDELLQVTKYFYRVDFYALFRIGDRPGRLQGPSIPTKTRDINDEIDSQHNIRITSRMIGTVPTFKALKSIKNEFDPAAEENTFKPGRTFWLSDMNAFDQFKVQPTDLGESMAEEKNDMNMLDLLLGSPVALFSGQTPTGDPSAPGNKTGMLIAQGNLRMDDPLDELRKGVEELGDICLSHLFQFGPNVVRFPREVESDGQLTKEEVVFHRRYLRAPIKMKMRGVTVAQNPDAEMSKQFQLHQVLSTSSPAYAQNPVAQNEVLREALRMGRVPNRQKILPTIEQIQQQQVAVQKAAMEQMLAERAAAMKQQQAEALKARLGEARQMIQTKKTAEQLAESGLGQ